MKLGATIALLFLGTFSGAAQEKPRDGGDIPWTRFGRKDTEKFHLFLKGAQLKAKPVMVFFT